MTGKYERDQPPPAGSRAQESDYVRRHLTEGNFRLAAQLKDWASCRGRSLGELAQAWLLTRPEVCSVITGAKHLDQLVHNVKAAAWKLTPEEINEIEAILKPEIGR